MTIGVRNMRKIAVHKSVKVFLCFALCFSFLNGESSVLTKGQEASLHSLLPEIGTWKLSEAPQNYIPGNLFEYINGAAEIYLAYDFEELIVGQYEKEKASGEASLSVEIYDMGSDRNSFGIYSAERYSESRFIPVGNQGYLEEGTLNFIVGQYYVKLLCFDCGEGSGEVLKSFSQDIAKRVKDKGQFPPVLRYFPQKGLIENSEKFILRNFMGYNFLHDGYTASYTVDGQDFECFIIEGENGEDARKMLEQYLERKKGADIQKTALGYLLKDRYYHNIFLAQKKNHIFGVIKIKDDFRKTGEEYMRMLLASSQE